MKPNLLLSDPAGNSESLVDNVYDTIKGAILRNELTPGTALSEATLAEQLGTSRTPIRDEPGVIAARQCGLEGETLPGAYSPLDLLKHQATRPQRSSIGIERRQSRRDQVHVDEIRTPCLAR